jgi:hypothetical protein
VPREQRGDFRGDLTRVEWLDARMIGQERTQVRMQREHTVRGAREILLRTLDRIGAVELEGVAHAVECGGEVRELVQHPAHHERDHRRFRGIVGTRTR